MNRILISTIVLSTSLACFAGAAQTQQSARQVLILRPVPRQGPAIEFYYRFANAVPPFEKEPALEGKEIARGGIPTVPPTPLIRNITDRELYLKTDHGQDFTTGPLATYQSECRDGIHVSFEKVRVFSERGGLAIPYTVSINTHQHLYAGRLFVQSGGSGTLERDGRSWRFAIVDNLDGQIDAQNRLYLMDTPPSTLASYHDCPVPCVLFLEGHAYRLDFTFKPAESEVVLETVPTEVKLPLGELRIEADGCRGLDLRDDRQAALLSNPAGVLSVPASNYRVDNCVLRSQGMPLRFAGSERVVSVQPGQTTSLRVGLPLSNTIVAARDRNSLRLTYQLVGTGGETYHYGGPMQLPSFRIYQGPLRIFEGSFGFG